MNSILSYQGSRQTLRKQTTRNRGAIYRDFLPETMRTCSTPDLPDGYRKYEQIAGILCPQRLLQGNFIERNSCQSFVAVYSCLISDLLGQSQCRILARLRHQCQKVLLPCSERTCDTARLTSLAHPLPAQNIMHFLHVNQAACIFQQFVDPQRRGLYNEWSRERTKCLELILTSSRAT